MGSIIFLSVGTTDGGMPALTVAIVSWNTRELLSRCLLSLQPSAQVGVADVWVLDNASSDGSPELVRDRFPWVKLIPSTTNLGFGSGVNMIAARTATPWLAPANADVELSPGALEALLAAGERHPDAGAIAPRLVLPDGTTQHSAFPFPTIPFTLAYVSGATSASPRLARRWCIDQGFEADHERDVPWAVGAFLLVRRRAWEAIGGFDEAQWMYAEDLDLGWRLKKAGWTTRYLPQAIVRHAESAATIQAWGDSRYEQWHASTYAWLLRRRGRLYTRAIAGANVAGFLAQAIVQTVASRLSDSEVARERRRSALDSARLHSIGLRSRHFLERVK
jgi:N-acetylglucosaminyl-diphospho-decaprenol L-rhamnosyltransferase